MGTFYTITIGYASVSLSLGWHSSTPYMYGIPNATKIKCSVTIYSGSTIVTRCSIIVYTVFDYRLIVLDYRLFELDYRLLGARLPFIRCSITVYSCSITVYSCSIIVYSVLDYRLLVALLPFIRVYSVLDYRLLGARLSFTRCSITVYSCSIIAKTRENP